MTPARLALFRAIVYATLCSSLQVLTVRMLSYVFPFQMIFAISLTAAFSILFTGLGALLANRLRRRIILVMTMTGALFFVSFLLISLGTLLPKSVMFAVTLDNVLALLPGGMVASIPLAAAAVAAPLVLSGGLAGGFYLTILEEDRPLLRWLVAGIAVGFFVGYAGTAFLMGLTGIWNLILVVSALAAVGFLKPLRFALAAFALIVTVLVADPDRYLFDALGREPLIWSQGGKPSRVAGFWSPYARLDFYDVGEERLAGLYNGIQWWLTGDTTHDLSVRRELYRHIAGDVLIIGSGGGHGLLSLAGASSITAVELDPGVIETLKGPLAGYNDGVYNRVDTYAMEGRAFLDLTDRRFDVVVYEAPEFVFANSEKSFVSMENYLYTLEGIGRAFERLRPGGTLIVYHTYGLIPTERFVKAYPPGTRWAVFRAEAELIRKVQVAFAVASREEATIERWREVFLRGGAEELSTTPAFAASLAAAAPVTDDRPLLHFRDWRQALPFIVSALLVAVLLGLMLYRRTPRRLPIFFALVGVGFIMTELAVINLLRSLLGGYVETTGVALGSLMLSSAVGALFHERMRSKWLVPLCIAGFVVMFLLLRYPPVAAPWIVKVLWIGAAVALPGAVTGVFFPAGLAAGAAAESSYFYAVDTVATALGFLVFYLVILAAGFTGAIATALLCYLVAARIFSRS